MGTLLHTINTGAKANRYLRNIIAVEEKGNQMRLIDADALRKAMYHRAFETDGDTMWQSGCWVRYKAIEQVVKEQPTVEAEPVRHGHWINHPDDLFPADSMIECSVCHEYEYATANDNFCGNCGAKMDEVT